MILSEPGLLANVHGAQAFPQVAAAEPQPVAEHDPSLELAALFTSGTTGVPSAGSSGVRSLGATDDPLLEPGGRRAHERPLTDFRPAPSAGMKRSCAWSWSC